MKKVISISTLILLILVFNTVVYGAEEETLSIERPKAIVTEIIETNKELDLQTGIYIGFQIVEVEILSGIFQGELVFAEKFNYPGDANFWLEEKDNILIQIEVVNGEIITADIVDYTRDYSTLILVSIFIALLIFFGQKQGLKSVLTLGLTLFLLFKVMIPLLFAGYNPILLALITGGIVTATTFLIVSGFTRKTLSALAGTVGGLFSAAVISFIFSRTMNLSGLHGDEERMLLVTTSSELSMDFTGLLLAGIIIGALGAVMDVAISIASSMDEVQKVDPDISKKRLFTSGMNVGKDIMGTMANTLILAYVGAALPLLLILYSLESPIFELIHLEFLVVEILRTVAGSIGLILSIPITAIVMVLLIKTRTSSTL
ncbi:YibE/F family protein [Bacillus sp. B15-48]|uniref:YibE/F family protein n=1 Tax=Bacillus sp. B15-48 TaxID=1548601 RepID=UPI00193F345C|nr:YibE/F family protein [Bacillus sp. B15-48]MBM4761366.1 YibE/F family protein [Bacillus sp. B15-48]